ncbi:translation initiation factor 2 [Kitasatospora sp. McL0602]|uniref:translation initiation factor 2 n=1 Tax=Kitasatospora sp. McL0602 TaxID=3439530 RepID=UPI003F8C5843
MKVSHSGQRAAGSGQRAVLFAVRSAGALHRLLDVLPVFEGDERIVSRFTLVPGSDFDLGALTALERSGIRSLSWDEACQRSHDLVLAASPKGALRALTGPRVLLPHGAGFNKTIPQEGSPHLPSGLDPSYLLADGRPWAALHALAHESQLKRLAEHSRPAAARAKVVGDPTLDRVLASLPHRERYRAALGIGARRLVAVTSTWGPESLLSRRPDFPARLVGGLPSDAYQFALLLHPNEHSRLGSFDLARQLGPALKAGLVPAGPHEEWAALLVACDAVITDHGSTALYAAALGRPVIGAYDGGRELIPGSPMDELLTWAPKLTDPGELAGALRAAGAQDTRSFAAAAFAEQGDALPRLQRELYRLLGLPPRAAPAQPVPFPAPGRPAGGPRAYAVRAEVSGQRVRVERFPAWTSEPTHHLAAEFPGAGQREQRTAAVLWRRALPGGPRTPHSSSWTAGGWTARILDETPTCRTAAAVLTPDRCLVRRRSGELLSVQVVPCTADGRVLRIDPAAAVSAVHAWLGGRDEEAVPTTLTCEIGPLTVQVRLAPATEADLDYEL